AKPAFRLLGQAVDENQRAPARVALWPEVIEPDFPSVEHGSILSGVTGCDAIGAVRLPAIVSPANLEPSNYGCVMQLRILHEKEGNSARARKGILCYAAPTSTRTKRDPILATWFGMSAYPEVLCAGIVVADHVCTPIGHLPAAGELVMADRLLLTIGGCAANVAVDLAKMGVTAGVVGRVGGDVFGRVVTDMLRDAGVDVASLQTSVGADTSQTLIVNVVGQDRRFIHT